MQEKPLLWVSLTVSFIGLITLTILSTNTHFDATPIKTISPEIIGHTIKVCGNVEKISVSKKGHTFFTLTDNTNSIRAVLFKREGITINEEPICTIGQVDLYKGTLEIIVKEVIND